MRVGSFYYKRYNKKEGLFKKTEGVNNAIQI
jgi:hypothetical protein